MTPIEYVEKIKSEFGKRWHNDAIPDALMDYASSEGYVQPYFYPSDTYKKHLTDFIQSHITLLELLLEEEKGKIKNTKDCGSWCYCSAHSWNDKCNDTIKRLEEIINKLKEQI